MRVYLKISFLSLLSLLVLIPAVRAASLDQAAIEAYVSSLEPVKALGERLQSEGRQNFLEREVLPRSGEPFDPHRRGVVALQRDSADDYRELTRIVQQHGFTSAESWALTGDRVVLAYGALKAEAESPEVLQMAAQMKDMDPAMLQLLPPEARQQMDQALAIARAIASVPQADRAVVRPYLARLDQLFSR